MSLGCPACGTSTKVVRWDDIDGLEFQACGGHFVAATQLARFFESHDLKHRFEKLVQNARAAPESPRNLSCSHCDGSSFRSLQAGVIEVDVCAGCASIYFDADEATRYLRQARFKAAGANAAELGVGTLEGTKAVVDLLHLFL